MESSVVVLDEEGLRHKVRGHKVKQFNADCSAREAQVKLLGQAQRCRKVGKELGQE